MAHLEAGAPVADVQNLSVVDLLAEIDRMHAEAVALLDALVRRWGHLWAARSDVSSCATEEFPVTAPPTVHGAHAEAA